MNIPLKLLHLEDSADDAELVKTILAETVPCNITRVGNRAEFAAALEGHRFDLVLSDYSLPGFDGLSALQMVQEQFPALPFVFVSGTLGEENAIDSLKHGAADYVLKDRLARLGTVVQRAMRDAEMEAERKQNERYLRESEQRYRDLFESNPHPMWVFDLETLAFLAVNEAAVKNYGYSRAGFLSLTLKEIFTEDEVPSLLEDLGTALEDLHRREWKHRKQDGTVIDVELTSYSLPFHGRPARLVLASDITQRKLAAEKILEQAALLDNARDAILVRDMDDQVLYWNKSAERLYGWSATEAIGRDARDLFFRRDSPLREEGRPQFVERGEWTGEERHATKDGKTVIVETRWTLLRDDQGRPKAKLIINTDVTERKQLEAQFLRAQRMEIIGALAGGIAHDLNNALAPILMGIELLDEDLPEENKLRMLATMRASARRGAEMVKQILSFARGVSGETMSLDVKPVFREIEKLARETFPRSIRISTDIAPNLSPIVGNATQLHQILLNLCVNARDAMPDGGTLSLEAANIVLPDPALALPTPASSGPYLVITVKDTGHGIPPELLERVFEPFFTTKEPGQGTGLGLSTVQGIVKSHGGFLEVQSDERKGTTFKVYLPAAPNSTVVESRSAPTALPTGSGELLLIVDDELAFLETARQTLEVFNYQVLTARDGAEALSLFQRHKGEIQAVIMDMMMPVMDGPTAIVAFRKVDPQARIIGITGLAAESPLLRASRENVAALLAKPYSTESLLTALRGVLDQPSTGVAGVSRTS